MMIEKEGKLFINGKKQKNRYDRNEQHGVDGQEVKWFEIVYEFKAFGFKLSISRFKVLRAGADFMTLAFDPPTNADKELA